jgi:filamentous hemagglutinin
LAAFTTDQLEGKWKHAADFGITTLKRNPTTLALYQADSESHLADVATIQNGTYLYVPGSKVFYNPITNLIVILDRDDAFVSGWRLTPGSPQWNKLIIDGVLR